MSDVGKVKSIAAVTKRAEMWTPKQMLEHAAEDDGPKMTSAAVLYLMDDGEGGQKFGRYWAGVSVAQLVLLLNIALREELKALSG